MFQLSNVKHSCSKVHYLYYMSQSYVSLWGIQLYNITVYFRITVKGLPSDDTLDPFADDWQIQDFSLKGMPQYGMPGKQIKMISLVEMTILKNAF